MRRDSNAGPSAYQPNALPLGQIGSALYFDALASGICRPTPTLGLHFSAVRFVQCPLNCCLVYPFTPLFFWGGPLPCSIFIVLF